MLQFQLDSGTVQPGIADGAYTGSLACSGRAQVWPPGPPSDEGVVRAVDAVIAPLPLAMRVADGGVRPGATTTVSPLTAELIPAWIVGWSAGTWMIEAKEAGTRAKATRRISRVRNMEFSEERYVCGPTKESRDRRGRVGNSRRRDAKRQDAVGWTVKTRWEERAQKRRTLTIVWTFALLFLGLALAAGGFAWYAQSEKNAAVKSAEEAMRQQRIAESRALAAQADETRNRDQPATLNLALKA